MGETPRQRTSTHKAENREWAPGLLDGSLKDPSSTIPMTVRTLFVRKRFRHLKGGVHTGEGGGFEPGGASRRYGNDPTTALQKR